jgi:hypothetical protein
MLATDEEILERECIVNSKSAFCRQQNVDNLRSLEMSLFERHSDFERVRAEFIKYYGSVQEGDREYQAWLKALGLDEDRSYGSSQERFSFVKPLLAKLRENHDNVSFNKVLYTLHKDTRVEFVQRVGIRARETNNQNSANKLTGTYTPPEVVPKTRVVFQEKPVYVEVPVPTEVEKLSLRLNKVLLEEKADRRIRINKALEEASLSQENLTKRS